MLKIRPILMRVDNILCDYACGGKNKHYARYIAMLERLHLFVNFKGRERKNYKIFKQLNPDYISCHKSREKKGIIKKVKGEEKISYTRHEPLFIDKSFMHEFWKVTKFRSIVFIDEAYECFGSLDQRSHGAEVRQQLLSYTRQHNHFKDDIFLISHKECDIDKIIRNGLEKHIVVKNSKFENVSDKRFARGFRWPIQFFMIDVYMYGDKKPSDFFHIFPDKIIFKTYNSFSISSVIGKEGSFDDDEDFAPGVDHKANWKNFSRQFVPFIGFAVATVVGFGWFLYMLIDGLATTTTSTTNPNSAVSAGVSASAPLFQPAKTTIKFITPDSITFSNKQVLKLGDYYHDFKVEKILSDSVYLSYRGRIGRFALSVLCSSEPSAIGPVRSAESSAAGGRIGSKSAGNAVSSGVSAASVSSAVRALPAKSATIAGIIGQGQGGQ